MQLIRRAALAALTAVVATAAPASAATLHLKAPREIDRAEKFRLKAFGQAKPQRAYHLSVLYQDDSQGRCERKLEKEVTTNEHGEVVSVSKIRGDEENAHDRDSVRCYH